jgi:hypothetical protein
MARDTLTWRDDTVFLTSPMTGQHQLPAAAVQGNEEGMQEDNEGKRRMTVMD